MKPTPLALAILVILLLAGRAAAQTPSDPSSAGDQPVLEPASSAWEFSISAMLVSAPDQRTYVQPTFTADRDWLHFEARYNYEALDTASLWAGYNFSGGKDLTFNFTPMLGVVLGDVNGVAPGYELTLNWSKLELYTEGEYVFSTESKSENFFYSWSQLTLTPVEHVYFGLAFQRTHAYHSDRELDVGPIVGVSFGHFDASSWILNLDDEHPIIGFSLEFTF